MTIPESNGVALTSDENEPAERGKVPTGTQTLARGLEIVAIVAEGIVNLNEIAAQLGLSRSTVHRLAATLVEHRYLDFARNLGYTLGPKLLELGYLAGRQLSLPRLARTYLEDLATSSGDTVHLAVRDGTQALYLDKIAGRRRVEISSRIGERQPLRSTGIGKALILDEPEATWRDLYDVESRAGFRYNLDLPVWLNRMRDYAERGHAFDFEENEDRIRCVAAPVRDASGGIAGAISISSAAQYMDEDRMHRLADEVSATATAISAELGWTSARQLQVATSKTVETRPTRVRP